VGERWTSDSIHIDRQQYVDLDFEL